MFSRVSSTTIFGLEAKIVSVEVDTGNGLPIFEMSGYLAGEVKESKERVKVAIRNSGYELRPQRIVVNISPADIRKDGTGFDLPIAIGILAANGIVNLQSLKDTVIIGELSLDGSVNSVNGILPSVCAAEETGYKICYIPEGDIEEGRMVEGIEVIGVKTLEELVRYLNKEGENQRKEIISNDMKNDGQDRKQDLLDDKDGLDDEILDYSDIYGQYAAKRATLIAAAGMHNIIYVGAPGSGKTMLAKRISTIMPDLSYEESMQLTKIYSVAGKLNKKAPMIMKRPFRSPHHNVTNVALLGGGRIPKPGEITLAGKGVLFLDEMTEFKTAVLESLRQPLEDKKITIVRLNSAYTYPADFMLAAAINPCKCGYYPDRNKCQCSEQDIRRYFGKISQPMWDRFDLSVHVARIGYEEIAGLKKCNDIEENIYTSEKMKDEIEKARKIQQKRFAKKKINFNSEMKSADIKKYCELGEEESKIMQIAYEKFDLTGRGYHKILKTARTIADLDGAENITKEHLYEAISYRSCEKG